MTQILICDKLKLWWIIESIWENNHTKLFFKKIKTQSNKKTYIKTKINQMSRY